VTADGSFDLISISEIVAFVRRRGLLIVLCVLVGGVCGFKGSGYIPKKYKAKAIVTIESGYFHHPLISDTVAEIQDPSEMSIHRLALIRAALTDQFLTDFYNTFISPNDLKLRGNKPVDPESILRTIEYFSTNPTSFQVSVTLNSPEKAFNATQRVLTEIITTLRSKREEQLTRAKLALERECELLLGALSLGVNRSAGGGLEAELSATRAQLAALEEHFASTHPDVVSLKRRLQRLQSRQGSAPTLPPQGMELPSIFLSPQSLTTKQEIAAELLKKISYLDIVLTMEREHANASHVDIIEHPRIPIGPFAPNRVQFILIGAVGALVLSLSLAVAQELRRRSIPTPLQAARYLELPLIAELPALSGEVSSKDPALKRGSTTTRTLFALIGMGCGR
jgi:uncharacterized protein involved in exopolysaccharide biosynthesis